MGYGADFEHSLAFVLEREGGFVDDGDDLGGRTNRGITQRTFTMWLETQGRGPEDVRNINEEEVRAIYFTFYWSEGKCEGMPERIALAHFDAWVNLRPKDAARVLQRAIRVTADGCIGPITMHNIPWADAEVDEVLRRYIMLRIFLYGEKAQRRQKSQKFLPGWLIRMKHLYAEVLPQDYP